MLKTLDPLLNGALLQILADMGHGNEIVIVDANYTASADAKRLVRHRDGGAQGCSVLAAAG
jgi:L-fucose mutarotase